MLKTRICDLLQIEYPIFAAPMGLITGPDLAAAVSGAGGMGIMSAGANPPEALRNAIRRLRRLTSRPVGVNVLLTEIRNFPRPVDELVGVCIEERVDVLSLYDGDPAPYVERAHRAGVKVMDQVGSVEAAVRSARAGVDIIVAQGVEAGGHLAGGTPLSGLLPRVVDAVAPTPVLAAGGIADARGVVAALAMGAEGVVMGTRFIATPESEAHPVYKQRLLAAGEADTEYTSMFGWDWPDAPHRVIRTRFVEEWRGREARGQEGRPDEPAIGVLRIGGNEFPILRFMSPPPSIHASGDIESMAMYAGTGVGLVNEIRPAGEIVREIAAEAQRIVQERLYPAVVRTRSA
jgi:nitronate monooxygenase